MGQSPRHQTLRSYGLQFMGSVMLAAAIYYVTRQFAPSTCYALREAVYARGPVGFFQVFGGMSIAAACGIPAPLLGFAAGVFFGSVTGSTAASACIVLTSSLWFCIGRKLGPNNPELARIERMLSKKIWYRRMLLDGTKTGMGWVSRQILLTPIPPALLSLQSGSMSRHLTWQGLVSGVFAGALPSSIAYSIAGSNIGCALIDSSTGLDASRYFAMILVSCGIVLAIVLIPFFMLSEDEFENSDLSKTGARQ